MRDDPDIFGFHLTGQDQCLGLSVDLAGGSHRHPVSVSIANLDFDVIPRVQRHPDLDFGFDLGCAVVACFGFNDLAFRNHGDRIER